MRDFTAHHHLDDFIACYLGRKFRADIFPVPEYRHFVGDVEQLVHFVGDVNDAYAFGFQVADDAEEMRDFLVGQRRGRLVHNQHIGFKRYCLGDLDHLAVGDGEVFHLRFRIEIDVQFIKQFLRFCAHRRMIDKAETVERLAADPDVFGYRHIWHQVQLLMNHGYAALQCIQRRSQPDFLALEHQVTLVREINPRDDFHQR